MIDSAEMASIPLSNEFSGTLKMFALFPSLQEVFEQGSVLFLDELNAIRVNKGYTSKKKYLTKKFFEVYLLITWFFEFGRFRIKTIFKI